MVMNRKVAARLAWPLVVACALCVAFAGTSFAQQRAVRGQVAAPQGNSTVRVMTRNMDSGTDLNYLIAARDLAEFQLALSKTIDEVLGSKIPERAARLAEEIAAAKPDLIALQEATYWNLGGADPLDQLALLEDALEAAGQHYRVVQVQTLTDIDLRPLGIPAQYIDRNAILARTDLPPAQLDVIASETHTFETFLTIPTPLGGVKEVQGWMAADIRFRGARFKFVNTHLTSALPGIQETVDAQTGQVQELLAGLGQTTLPIILGGDFNSDAVVPQQGIDKTPAAALVASAGYTEAWHAIYPSDLAAPGYTWPLFMEDQLIGLPPALFLERIDLIFSRGAVATSVSQTGTTPDAQGVYASDHAGVVADFFPTMGLGAVPRK